MAVPVWMQDEKTEKSKKTKKLPAWMMENETVPETKIVAKPVSSTPVFRRDALAEKKLAEKDKAQGIMKFKTLTGSSKSDKKAKAVIPAYNSKSPFYNTPIIGDMLKKEEEKTRETAAKVLNDKEFDILAKGLTYELKSENMPGGITQKYFKSGQNVPKDVSENFDSVWQKVEYAKKGKLEKVGSRIGRKMAETYVGDKSAQQYAESMGIADTGKVGNVVGDIAGTILGYAGPSGTVGNQTMIGASNKLGENAIRKLSTKIPSLAKHPLVSRAAQGLIEDIPLTAYTAMTEKQTPKETLKTYAQQAPYTIGGELLFHGLGKAGAKIGDALAAKKAAKTGALGNIVDVAKKYKTLETKQLPSAERLLLPEKATGSLEAPSVPLTQYEKSLLKTTPQTPKATEKLKTLAEKQRQQVASMTGSKVLPEQPKKLQVSEQYKKEMPRRVTSAEIEQTKGTVPDVKKLNMPEPAKTNAGQTPTPVTGAKRTQTPSIETGAKKGIEAVKTPEEKVSKVYSNTLKKTKMMSDAEKEMLDAKDFKYDVKSESASMAEAQSRLASDFEGEVKKLSEKESFTSADIDTMFGILEKNLDDARKTGDYTEVNNILKNVRKGGTEEGRAVQSFAKYSRTTEGKLAEAQGVVDKVEKNLKKTNPNLASKIDDEVAELTKKTEKTPKVTKKEEIRVWLDSKESEATQRIREYFNPDKSGVIKMRAGLPGEVLTDLAIVGATKLAKVTLDFTDWSAEMIKEFGDKVKPHLEEVYNASKKVLKGGSSNLPKPKTVKDIGKYTSPEDIANLVKKKYGLPVIDNDDIKYIVDTMEKSKSFPEGSYNQRMLQAKVEQRIANKIPSTFMEKFQAAQRISMLLNPKTTLVRNPVGNVLLGTMETIKNIPGAAIDTVVSAARKSERTTKLAPIAKGKATLKGFSKGLKEWAQDIKNNVDTSPVGGQAEMPKKKIFNENAKNPVIKTVNKAANFTHSIVGRMLKVGDSPFYNGAYNSRIAELKKIKGVSEVTDAMKDDAHLFALERTLQNDSGMSAMFTGIKSANFLNKHPEAKFVYQFFANLILPFAKTPANILDKFIDYSPVGAVKAIGHGIATKGKGTFNQKKFVDTMARSLTGTGLIAAGYLMAKNGLITGARDTSNKVENIETALGKQNYAYKVGDTYQTFDWALPAAAPFAMGADIYNAVARTKEGQNAALKGTESAVNLLFKSTLLQNPSRMMSGYSPAASIGSTLLGSTTQFTPTAGKQIAQLRDPYQRETYDPNWVIQMLNKTKARIPKLSETLPAKVDVFGENIKAFQGKNNVWNVLFNPGFSTEFKPTKEQKEIIRLYEDTGETGHIPIAAEKYISATKEHPKITLTAREYVYYQKKIAGYTFNGWSAKGKLKSSTGFNGVINSDAYKNAKTDSKSTADAKRVSMLSKIIENAKKQAKEEILKKRGY